MSTQRKAGYAQMVVIIGLLVLMIAVCREGWTPFNHGKNGQIYDPIPTESTRAPRESLGHLT